MIDPVTCIAGLYAVSAGVRAYRERQRLQHHLEQAGLETIPEVRTVHLANPDKFIDTLSEESAQAFVEAACLGEFLTTGRPQRAEGRAY